MGSIFREGQELLKVRDKEVKMERLTEQILARLLVLKSDESSSTKEKHRLHLPGRHMGQAATHAGEEEEENLRLHVLNSPVFSACQAALAAVVAQNATLGVSREVLKEGWAECHQAKGKKLVKKWLVLTRYHLERWESPESRCPEKQWTLLEVAASRVPPRKAMQHVVELATLKKVVAFNFSSSSEADFWMHAFLENRLVCLTVLLDMVPGFRNLVFAKAQAGERDSSKRNSAEWSHQAAFRSMPSSALGVSIGGPIGVGGGASTSSSSASGSESNLKFAFLEFQRVAMAYDIALSLHDNYVGDVAERLQRLDALAEQRAHLREQIASMEVEMVREERAAQAAGKTLSQVFGNVLESVGIVHESLQSTHTDLILARDYLQIPGTGLTDEQKDTVFRFRQMLDILDAGLSLDVPLKAQLAELELRESEVAGEIEELVGRSVQLEEALQGVRSKRETLEMVMSSAGHLQAALQNASNSVVHGEQDLEKIVDASLQGFADAPTSFPSLRVSVLGKAVRKTVGDGDLSEILGGVAILGAADMGSGVSMENDVAEDSSPTAIISNLFTSPMREMEQMVLRCFEYFMKPIQLMEIITLAYCDGPTVSNTAEETLEIERKMASVRLRALNLLRKWVRTQRYHFQENSQLRSLLDNFLACVKVTGNEKLGLLIEAESREDSMVSLSHPSFLTWTMLRDLDGIPPSSFLDLYPQELARQLCLLDQALYRKLEPREFIRNNFMRKNADVLSPNIKAFAMQFNHVAAVVFSSILQTTMLERRQKMVTFWIDVMRHLRALRNYQSLLAIVGGLTCTPVNRLKLTWADLTSAVYFEECKTLMDKNFSLLRSELETAIRPVIPYIGAFQRDLVYLEEGPTMKGTQVNVHKLKAISAVIGNVLQYQNSGYNWFESLPRMQRLVMEFPILDENAAHAKSLELEPREVPKTAAQIELEKKQAEERLKVAAIERKKQLADALTQSGLEPEKTRQSRKSNLHESGHAAKSAKILGVPEQTVRQQRAASADQEKEKPPTIGVVASSPSTPSDSISALPGPDHPTEDGRRSPSPSRSSNPPARALPPLPPSPKGGPPQRAPPMPELAGSGAATKLTRPRRTSKGDVSDDDGASPRMTRPRSGNVTPEMSPRGAPRRLSRSEEPVLE